MREKGAAGAKKMENEDFREGPKCETFIELEIFKEKKRKKEGKKKGIGLAEREKL